MKTCSRRWFIGGAGAFGAFGAFGGNRFLLGGADRTGVTPNLTLGVLSDVHLGVGRGEKGFEAGTAVFRKALEWYRDQRVDAVMIVGDIADRGWYDQLEAAADVWRAVFPDDRAPDGRPVKRLFVYGNHEWEGSHSHDHEDPRFLGRDFAGYWERTFDEPYEPIGLKTVKGYSFIGQHWDHQGWFARCKFERIEPFMAEHGKELDPSRPFFYYQHPHPRDTVYGPWANISCDTGISTRVLSAYPNAIALSGHSHLSLTDERSIWQGAFTSVGTASLKYTGMPADCPLACGYENGSSGAAEWKANAWKAMQVHKDRTSHQGMLWRVYDDCIVMRRHEFSSGLDLGADWTLPLPAAEPKPFAFAEHAKKIAAPSFAPGAVLKLERTTAKIRGGRPKNAKPGEEIEPARKDALKIVIPAALAKDGARVIRYRVEVCGNGEKLVKYVLAEGFNHPAATAKAAADITCLLALEVLPKGNLTVRVLPENCFGKIGRALESKWSA